MRYLSLLLGLIQVSLFLGSAEGRTIRVAKDGSGDFSVVADAVEAAVSGDTVSIAPGDYPEVREYSLPGGTRELVAYAVVSELTIIGDGRDDVVLGPETPAADLETGPIGINCSASGNVRVRGVTVRNTAAGVWGSDDWVDVSDCKFSNNHTGVLALLSGFATVKNSEFKNSEDAGVLVFSALGGTGALVEECSFIGNKLGIDFQPYNCEVRNSSFEGGIVGVQASFGGSTIVRQCTFDAMSGVGFGIVGGAQGYAYDCVFEPTMPQNITVDGLLGGSGNELNGGTTATVRTTYRSAVTFNNNHILNGGALSIWARNGGSPPVKTQDFTGNFWGTTDTTQIDEWIYDVNDDPVVNYILVDYTPLAEQPISVEQSSFGRLKARY